MTQKMCEYQDLVFELLQSEEVRSMGQWKHHGPVTCLDHSLFVSYLSFRAARFLHLDAAAAARGGLLHDLYLYDPEIKPSPVQCVEHPKIACQNAAHLTPLSGKERNIILSHMWPLGGALPRSPEAWLVDLTDTVCAFLELSRICRPIRLREKLGVRGFAQAG